MLDPSLPPPADARSFTSRRRIRLADMDATGRLRLDAVARFLQDAAIDDVQETGWGAPAHLWVVRKIRVDVIAPPLNDRALEIVTWCSGVAAIAAGRRWSLAGDAGGRIEVDSVWIHLGADQRPGRIGDFGPYAAAAGERSVSTKLLLPDPPDDIRPRPWPLRSTDIDAHGHVNNAVYWQAVEGWLAEHDVDTASPYHAELDYREPVDLGDHLELVPFESTGGAHCLAFATAGRVRAVASVAVDR